MTKKLAIQILRGEVLGTNEQTHEAVFMAIKALKNEQKCGEWIHGRETAREMVGDCITAIFYEDWKCSNCGYTVKDGKPVWNYCPNCGARMDL